VSAPAALLALSLLASDPRVLAQDGRPADLPAGELAALALQGVQREDSPGERRTLPPRLRERFEELRRHRMAESLGLEQPQAEAVERELRAFRDRQAELRIERVRLLRELRRRLEEGSGEAELRDGLEALRRNREERDRALQELHRRLGRELTLEQQARLQLFAERFQRQIHEAARRLRER
jgi:hypothetical protein